MNQARPERDGTRRSVVFVVLVTFVATLLLAWATWVLFLTPRKGGDTVEGLVESIAEQLREGDFAAVKERLDPAFTLDPGGLGREEAIGIAEREHAAGRFFPYVATMHLLPLQEGGDVQHVAVIGILAQGEPEKNRNVNLIPVRLELKVRDGDDGFRILSARSRIGR